MRELRGSKILVTGGAGFIGSHLCRELVSQGAKVTVVDDFSNGTLDNLRGIECCIVHHDISEPPSTLPLSEHMRQFDGIFHLACYPRSMSFGNPERCMRVNAGGTLNVIRLARESGAGHTVTAIYEILSPEQAQRLVSVDGLRYQTPNDLADERWGTKAGRGEIATVKLRYKAPQGQRSRLLEVPVKAHVLSPHETSDAFRFSAAVAGFGMLLRDSEYKGNSSYGQVLRLAESALGADPYGHKREFLSLVAQAERL